MNVCIVVFLLYLSNLINIQRIKQHLLLPSVLGRGQSVPVDINKSVIEVLEPLEIGFSFLYVYHKEITVTVHKI